MIYRLRRWSAALLLGMLLSLLSILQCFAAGTVSQVNLHNRAKGELLIMPPIPSGRIQQANTFILPKWMGLHLILTIPITLQDLIPACLKHRQNPARLPSPF